MSAGTEPAPGVIVVGVGRRSASPTALRWAVRQAELTGARVLAVRPWKVPAPQATPSGTSADRVPVAAMDERQAQADLEREVQDVLGADHDVEVRVVRGGKVTVLLEAASGADLLVVDAPARRATEPLLPQRLAYQATCPVVTIPPHLSEEPEGPVTRAGRAVGREALRSAGTAGRPGYQRPVTGDAHRG